MVVDLDKIEVKDFDKEYLKDDGTYNVNIVDAELGVTEKNGTPFVKFSCETRDNKWINMSLYLTDKAMPRFKRFIMACGHPGTGQIDPNAVAMKCVGRVIQIDCAHRETIDPVTGEKVQGKYLEVVNFRAC